jgi:hypothetical protein
VSVTSDKLQGQRQAATEGNGIYILRALPPGTYKVTFSLEGMQAVEHTAEVPLGGSARSDAEMSVAAAAETVIVTGESPATLETTTTGANFRSETINGLPIPTRSPDRAALRQPQHQQPASGDHD